MKPRVYTQVARGEFGVDSESANDVRELRAMSEK
jgi:hypothetical protein